MSRSVVSPSAPDPEPVTEHGHRVRRRQYIDQRLQGVLLVCLILLESGMLLGAMLYLYLQFSAAIDANLFTIHRSAQVPLLPTFLKELGLVVVVMGAINTVALIIANQLWVGQIKRVTGLFRERLMRVAELDLCAQGRVADSDHEVLLLLDRWRSTEAERARLIDGLLAELATLDCRGEPDRSRCKALLEALDRQLQSSR